MNSLKTLVQGSALTTSAAVYYTAPTGINTQIAQMSLTNTDSTARTVSVYLVKDTAIPGTVDYIIKDKTLQPNETYIPYPALGFVVTSGGSIQAVASTGSVVVFKASGVESSN